LGGETDAFNLGGEADEGALDADGGGADEFPDLPGDLSGGTDESAEAGAGDSFDGFSLGGEDWKPPEETLDTPDFAAPSGGEGDFDDFSLAGFDDAFAEPGKAGPGKAGPAKAGTPGRAAGPLPAADEVEEIRLSEGDFKRLQETLSAYPLNLRIACEELIAVEAVAPDLMSSLIKLLVRGAPAKETAALAGKILGRTIPIPKGYAKKTGAELEEEQASFGYIFVRRFLPVLRLVGAIALVIASLAYLTWRFVVVPLQAESLYKEGFVMLKAGEYTQANEQFRLALEKRRVKNWFYRYAEGFRDERQYIYAERKYDELLRVYPRDKKGALDYAGMETNYLKNYEKADRIIRDHILDWAVNDRDGLLALAENNLAWGETEPARYEDARAAYARLMEQYGRLDPYLEGMLKYFIRTDQLAEVLRLQSHFMGDPKKRKITVPTLAELGGYLLDKRFEEAHGVPLEEPPAVPEEYADQIEGIRDVLERAVKADGTYPESYYHLARYYNRYGSSGEERQSLRDALRNFAAAREETPRRAAYRVDAHRRYAEVLINAGEFFPAEEELIRGVRLYEDARARQVLKTGPEFGRLYADLGDLEFFVKNGDMTAALRFYEEGERNGWAPPEIQYRMGAAHYQNEEWEAALGRFFLLSSVMPDNRRLLYALGNTSYLRGNYFAAQGYYNRLMDLLAAGRVRFPSIAPGSRPEEQDLAERIMVVNNNLGVTLEALTRISGDTGYRGRALGLFSESIRAWDILTRNPESMSRMRPFKDLYGPGVNLAYLNAQNILRPEPGYEQQIFMRIDRDALEPSPWELLAPRDYRLSDQMMPMPVE
ncbi:MAG: tetratricopeptide repeat protein, partial [Treponema sp.]|nr:tetratricopeptide repeat protein [Treponema sp.]